MRVGPTLTWISLHLIALGASALAVPLWAHHPLPREALAAHVMVAVEMAASAMLWPLLFPNIPTAVVASLLVWPFIQLAGMLGDVPQFQLLLASIYVSLWIVGLAMLNRTMASPGLMQLARAVISAVVFGGIVLAYLRSESTPAMVGGSTAFGPLLGALALLDANRSQPVVWLETALPLLAAATLLAIEKRTASAPNIARRVP